MCRTGLFVVSLAIVCQTVAGVSIAQDQEDAPTSYRFKRPIPVTVIKTSNSKIQGMLLGIDLNSISVMTTAGKKFDFPNDTVRYVTTPDNSFNYSPGKDDPAEMIKRLNQLQPSTGNGATPAQPNTGFGQGAAPGGGMPAMPGNPQMGRRGQRPGGMPQPMPGGAPPSAQDAHSQWMAGMQPKNPNSSVPPNTTPPNMMPHNMTPPNMAPPNMAPPSMPPNFGPHAQARVAPPSMPMAPPSMPPSVPTTQHGQQPGMAPGMPNLPQSQQVMYQYECSKCGHKITSPTLIEAGHRCAKCGVMWDQVQDENGHITSQTTASQVGKGVGAAVVIIGIIFAVMRKAKSD